MKDLMVVFLSLIVFVLGMFAGHSTTRPKEIINKVVWDSCQNSVLMRDSGTTQMITCFKDLPKQPMPK